MAINSIGNLTYINQASSATAAIQAGNIAHPSAVNHSVFHEQMQKTEEVRPTEETRKADDREGNGKREFEEGNSREEESSEFENALAEGLEAGGGILDSPNEEAPGEVDTNAPRGSVRFERRILDVRG